MESNQKLPQHIINTVIGTVFSREYINGKYQPYKKYENFGVDKLIHITEALKQYYSLDEKEENALMHLYAWEDAIKLFDKIQSDYSNLVNAHRSISDCIDRLYQIERERKERREYARRERYDEKWERHGEREYELQRIYKEVAYEKIPFEKFYEYVTQNKESNPIHSYNINIPNILIDKEVFTILDKRLNDQRNKVEAITSAKNEAFSILKQYIYRIVDAEEITPLEDDD